MEIKLEIKDLKNTFRRRKKSIFIPFLLIFAATVGVSYLLPPVYQSEATILIEGKMISDDFVAATVTGFVEERIEMITAQIMTRARLMEIINEFNLYPENADQATAKELSDKFRKNISLETIDVNVNDRKSGKAIVATIAFKLSYQGFDPGIAQKVTDKLASLYVEEYINEKDRNTAATIEFFQVELDALKKKIEIYEDDISKFKQAHIEEMPEYNAINIQALKQLEKEYDQIHSKIDAQKNQKIRLKARLTGVDPSTKTANTETAVNEKTVLLNPKDRLRQLRIQLINLQSAFSDKHPDIKRLKRAIKQLETKGNNSDDRAIREWRLKEIEDQLSVLRERLSPKHPDLLKLSKEARLIKQELKMAAFNTKPAEPKEARPDNSAYINLQVQIIGVDTEIQALVDEEQKIKKRIKAYRQKLHHAPIVEKKYSELTRDYENARLRYRELSDKLIEAKLSQELDASQRGARFHILEPAYLPIEPSAPNRKAILLLGFLMAWVIGFSFAVFREYTDTSIKTKDELSSLTSIPVFAEVPLIERRSTRRVKKFIWSCATLLILSAALLLTHRYIFPIDMLWAKYSSRVAEHFQ